MLVNDPYPAKYCFVEFQHIGKMTHFPLLLQQYPKVIVTLGSKEVLGFNNYQGTGFLLEGTAKFYDAGEDYDMIHEKYPFANRVLEITVTSSTQKL